MNFSKISEQTAWGKLLRIPLKLIPKNFVVRIIQGPLKGKKWIVGSFNHGCWLGTYEYEKQKLFAKYIRPGYVIWDVGAHVGMYTLLAAVLTGEKGRVIAFEPLPANLEYLKKHASLNRLGNVEIIPAAVDEMSGDVPFETQESRATGRISPPGGVDSRSRNNHGFVCGEKWKTRFDKNGYRRK